MRQPSSVGMKEVQRRPLPEPQGTLPSEASMKSGNLPALEMKEEPHEEDNFEATLEMLQSFIMANGDISDLLSEGQLQEIGINAVREWRTDLGSNEKWRETADRGLNLASQDTDNDDEKNYPWEGASDIHYPILTQAAQQWAARAYPELVKGDKAVGIKVFNPPPKSPSPGEIADLGPKPQDPQDAQASQMAMQQDQQQNNMLELAARAKNARGERVAHYMNWTIFYRMDDWEGETDLMLNQLPITGNGFKKVYRGDTGFCSDYVAPLRLTVHASTKSIYRCPRITHDFDLYPYEIEQGQRSGRYRSVQLPSMGADPENPRLVIEQHRLEDLDGDGLPEPYIVTVDVETQQVLSLQPAYGMDDVIINQAERKIVRIERDMPFADFKFIPDPRGSFYATGFARLLESITDSIDTSINQLMDAGNAEIAGGGFIGSNLRLTGSGQGGSIWFRPGEYQTVSTPGADVRAAIYERTVPHPSGVTMQLLELLLSAAKDIASIKDVITGDGATTAPVGTTLALQNQALQVFSSIYKRVYRGFRDEFRILYRIMKRYATDEDKFQYQELTGGNFDEDFAGDGTDIQPVADPSVVTKMQKISRIQTLIQMAESPVGQAAGMTQARSAQALILDALDVMDIDRPERFISDVQPNPIQTGLAQAQLQEKQAAAQLKVAQAVKAKAEGTLNQARSLREVGLAAVNTHELHGKSEELLKGGSMTPMEGASNATEPPNAVISG
jgi:chaperonin GroES